MVPSDLKAGLRADYQEVMYIKYPKIMDNVQHQCMPINNGIRNMAIFRNCEYGEPFVSYRLHFKCCCFT